MGASYISDGDQFSAGKPEVWSQTHLPSLGGNYPYDLAPDGKRFAIVMNPGEREEYGMTRTDSVIVLFNFFDELRRKIPTSNN